MTLTARILCLLLVVSAGLPALAGPEQEKIQRLETENARLKMDLFNLRRELEELRKQVAATTEPSDPARAASDQEQEKPGGSHTWIVRINSNEGEDPAPIQQQISGERRTLPDIEHRLRNAQRHFDYVSSQTEQYRFFFADGDWEWRTRLRHSALDIEQARRDTRKVEDELRRVKSKIARLERELREAPGKRTITGNLEDGRPVQIVPVGPGVDVAPSLLPGMTYRVVGLGTDLKGMVNIRMRGAAPEVEPEPLADGQNPPLIPAQPQMRR